MAGVVGNSDIPAVKDWIEMAGKLGPLALIAIVLVLWLTGSNDRQMTALKDSVCCGDNSLVAVMKAHAVQSDRRDDQLMTMLHENQQLKAEEQAAREAARKEIRIANEFTMQMMEQDCISQAIASGRGGSAAEIKIAKDKCTAIRDEFEKAQAAR